MTRVLLPRSMHFEDGDSGSQTMHETSTFRSWSSITSSGVLDRILKDHRLIENVVQSNNGQRKDQLPADRSAACNESFGVSLDSAGLWKLDDHHHHAGPLPSSQFYPWRTRRTRVPRGPMETSSSIIL
ncbi:unnamed protein product [Calypogeia fissa]